MTSTQRFIITMTMLIIVGVIAIVSVPVGMYWQYHERLRLDGKVIIWVPSTYGTSGHDKIIDINSMQERFPRSEETN